MGDHSLVGDGLCADCHATGKPCRADRVRRAAVHSGPGLASYSGPVSRAHADRDVADCVRALYLVALYRHPVLEYLARHGLWPDAAGGRDVFLADSDPGLFADRLATASHDGALARRYRPVA